MPWLGRGVACYARSAQGIPKGSSGECRESGNCCLAIFRKPKRNVHDGLEIDGGTLFCGRAEFPLAEGLHGVGVELFVDTAYQLNAVHRTVAANHSVEHDFPFDTLFD